MRLKFSLFGCCFLYCIRIHEFDRQVFAITSNKEKLVALRKLVIHNRIGQWSQQVALNRAFERSCSEIRSKASLQQELTGSTIPFYCPGSITQPAALENLMQFFPQDLAHGIPAERAKHDHSINTIQEFLSKGNVHCTLHGCRAERGAIGAEPEARTTPNRAAQIGCHDDNGVAEVCRDAATVS